ncbi:restriction endonuclease subunit S [Serratia proteamaculans]|uniref:restriction endonuclease subunit S n=1 Tax=Serratia proteamaculans TaxID=28151 RepID=UPI0039BEAF9B
MSSGKLPEGWAGAPVSSVATLIRGVTYKKEQAINYRKDDYLPLIRANNIQNGKFDTTDLVFVPKNLVKESQKISPEDIVIAMSSGSKSVVGKSAHQHLPFECSFGAFCGVLRPEKLIFPSFIAHFTKSSFYRNKISSLSAGANINNVKPASFDLIKIPIPSLGEQKIIADKLDTLLAQVDSSKARLEQIPQILKRFRQAVLATAVSGKLTHINAANKLITLGDIAKDIRYGTSKKCSEDEGNTAVLRIPNIGLGYIINKNIKYANFEQKELSALALIEGDLLLIRSNGSVDFVGKVAVISENDTKYLYAGYLIRVRLDQEKAMPKYISYCLQSPQLRQVIENIARSTSGVNNINSKELAALELPLPTLAGQQEIIRRVEQLFAYADTIEKQIDNALARVNNLTQSILAKAFCGELTAQWRAENPELISGENSAAALLKKIKDEREAIKRLPKPKRSAINKKIGKHMSKKIIKAVEALAQVGEPLSGQQLLVAAGYPSDSSTDDLEKFFLDMRQALTVEKSIVKLERSDDGQDWFSLAEVGSNE